MEDDSSQNARGAHAYQPAPLSIRFNTHEVRDLAWVFSSPGLLNPACFDHRVETDADFRLLMEPYWERLRALDQNPQPILEFLGHLQTYGRLGRYFENLLRFFLLEFLKAERVITNLQIQESGVTKGELDLLFCHPSFERPHHWEASVKFYLCVTTDPEKARTLPHFMGTLVEDRLDRKLEKLLHRQLELPRSPAGQEKLAALGLLSPESRALLKGMLFYPSHVGWLSHPHPAEVAADHDRGWWTTSEILCFPQQTPQSLYMELPPGRWLSLFKGPILPSLLMTRDELTQRVRAYFAGPETPRSIFREMMVSEVQPTPPPPEASPSQGVVWVEELSRGHILHREWPRIADAAAHEPIHPHS